jgi:uncharacterized radical SAM protein YgiQ
MFLPTTKNEVKNLGWEKLDIILVTGDTYIDSPFIGTAVIANLLSANGFKVGVIAQPDVASPNDITRLGGPKLFWGITGGSVDSMVANYTASNKRRKQDDYTPGGKNNRRPDRAIIAYSNLIKRYFKSNKPLVLGGIEASLRRVTHYDYWSNKLRRPILFDAKADYLVYGMGEKAILELANSLAGANSPESVRGVCYIAKNAPQEYLPLASFEKCLENKTSFTKMFHTFYENTDPLTAKGWAQKCGDRFLVQNPPQPNPSTTEMDSFYSLDYKREVHPYYASAGKVRAMDTIRYSISTHRGCYGECNFCAIAVHEGRTIINRSKKSILAEAEEFTRDKNFKGIISDVGGPTANMYGFECSKKLKKGVCDFKRCVFPDTCKTLKPSHKNQIELLRALEKIKGVKKVFVSSGIRYDLITDDEQFGKQYLKKIALDHTSGQLKIAPEHTDEKVLELMGKPGNKSLLKFKDMFFQHSKNAGKKQFLTYYFIAAHPGCGTEDMKILKDFASHQLEISPEQVQIFTPTPSTYSSLMYYTEQNPFTGKKLFVEKNRTGKEKQKNILTQKPKRK